MSVAEILDYTYEDYRNWEGDWELIEGIPVSMAPAPQKIHRRIAGEIFAGIAASLEMQNCPDCEVLYEIDWKINEETVVRPDIVLSCRDESEAYLSKAPKIVVEVLSPSTARKDETVKFDLYEAEGVRYYLLVYPEDLKAKVYRLTEEGRYLKVGDFTHETLSFEDLDCELSLDFARIFGKFRKSS